MKIRTAIYLSAAALMWVQTACSPSAKERESTATENPSQSVAARPDTAVSAETVASKEFAAFKFETQEYNFGTIPAGKKVRYAYKFTNTGNIPLVISQVQPQCGCTAADYPKDPVPPGGQGEIVLEFDSQGREGQQNKITTVYANVPGGSTILAMTGTVEPLPDGRPLRKN